MNINQKHQHAAGLLSDLIVQKLGKDRAVHPETAISSAARISGSLLFRSFKFDTTKVAPGSAVLSNEANEKCPILINIAASELNVYGMVPDHNKRGKAGDVSGSSRLSVLETQDIFQHDIIAILEKSELDFENGAYAAAMTAGWLVKECAPAIGLEKGFEIAVYGFIEGSKTVPKPLQSATHNEAKRPWYKLW